MAKIIRPNMTLPIFGEDEADKLTVFGTGKDVTDTGTPAQNVEGIVKGDGSKWKKGWIFQNPQAGDVPLREDFNNISYLNSYINSYLLQQGIPEWSSEQEYYTNGFCQYNGKFYISLQGTNDTPNLNKNPATATTYWRENFVTTIGNQSISGLKTFNSYPRIVLQNGNVPTPSNDADFVTKKYVDNSFTTKDIFVKGCTDYEDEDIVNLSQGQESNGVIPYDFLFQKHMGETDDSTFLFRIKNNSPFPRSFYNFVQINGEIYDSGIEDIKYIQPGETVMILSHFNINTAYYASALASWRICIPAYDNNKAEFYEIKAYCISFWTEQPNKSIIYVTKKLY